MFSFFKRAKKDAPEPNGPSKDKKAKEKNSAKNHNDESSSSSPKNNSAPQSGNNNNYTDAVPSESRLKPDEKVTITDDTEGGHLDEPIISETYAMDVTKSAESPKISPTPVTSAANIVKSEIQQRKSSVRPCGHGTVAISPAVPPNHIKKFNTPPSSPILELGARPKYRRTHSCEQSPQKDDALKSGKISPLKDSNNHTIMAPMKLKLDLPQWHESNKAILVNGLPECNEKKNLINQEAKFQSQLNEVSKQLSLRDAEANKLRFQMEELQRDVFAKSAGMDRLQGELQAALKESDYVRQRLRRVEEDLQNSKQKNTDLSEELAQKTERFHNFQSTTNAKITELQSTIRVLRAKIESMEMQLDMLEKEKENLEKQKTILIQQWEDDKKSLEAGLQNSIEEKLLLQKKFEDDFEKMRTVNIVKEQELSNDFEWKLREIEQTCKKRLQEKDKRIEDKLAEAYKEAENKIKQAQTIMKEVENLRSFESEVQQLRGTAIEQQQALNTITHQLEEIRSSEQNLRNESRKLRKLVDTEKENLQRLQRMHSNDIIDKERKLKETMQEQKTAIAVYWEDKLLQECSRLKSELDQLHYEERSSTIETIRLEKDEELNEIKKNYETKIQDCLKDVSVLKASLTQKDEYYRKQLEITQTNTDRDIFELRRIMDKINMSHHERFEELVLKHEEELEKINNEHEKQLKEVEGNWQLQVSSMRTTVELVKEQMEKESQQKLQLLIEQHRSELDAQWQNLIHQKSEAIRLVEEEYVTKYKTLEEQFYTQQKSHESREVELLKTIDSLKNEINSKESTIEDLQNNVDTLEGGIQVLNQEMAFHGETVTRTQIDAEHKMRRLQETVRTLQEQHTKENEEQQSKLAQIQIQSQTTIEHLQRKCQCLTKLFEEVRGRYEKRESRQEDLNIISDLRQVIAEQEKDLACLNEEKRYFQMKLMKLEKFLDQRGVNEAEDGSHQVENDDNAYKATNNKMTSQFSIPPTIHECEDDFEDAIP